MKHIDTRIIAHLCLLLFLFVCMYYLYLGITTMPSEGDSLAYHIPIAKTIINGNFLTASGFKSPLYYYPGSSEAILSIFIFLGLPLNLYNVFGLVVLFFVLVKLGRSFELNKNDSLIFATSVCLLTSVIRLLPTQTIDIWLAVFFAWSFLLLRKPKKTMSYFLQLGFAMGMLIGTKYSGPFLASVLLVLYYKRIIAYLNIVRLAGFLFCVVVFGVFWYARNYIAVHNPVYPASIFMWKGAPGFILVNWPAWKTIFLYPHGAWLFVQAMVSEYLLWSISLFASIVYVCRLAIKKSFVQKDVLLLVVLSLANLAIYLFLPSYPKNLLSNLRYLYPCIIPSILAVFLLAKQYKKMQELTVVSFIGSVLVIPQLDYYPKLVFIFLVFVIVSYRKIATILQNADK